MVWALIILRYTYVRACCCLSLLPFFLSFSSSLSLSVLPSQLLPNSLPLHKYQLAILQDIRLTTLFESGLIISHTFSPPFSTRRNPIPCIYLPFYNYIFWGLFFTCWPCTGFHLACVISSFLILHTFFFFWSVYLSILLSIYLSFYFIFVVSPSRSPVIDPDVVCQYDYRSDLICLCPQSFGGCVPYFLASGFPTFLVLSVNILVLVNSIIIYSDYLRGILLHLLFSYFLPPLPPVSRPPIHKLYFDWQIAIIVIIIFSCLLPARPQRHLFFSSLSY